MIAGIGGIVALVIAYRKQRNTEEGRFMTSLENAARQMGALEPTVQFAGIYAIASLADDSSDERKQKCVDVLCGYLRLPYTPTSNVSTLREIAERRTWFEIEGGVQETRVHQFRPAEKEVRLTIIRTITERLRVNAPDSWSTLDLDFSGAVFDCGDFTGAHFYGVANFRETHFDGGTVDFTGAHFDGVANFRETHFDGGSSAFTEAHFNGTADFTGAYFDGLVDYSEAQFNGTTDFTGAYFDGLVDYSEARFNNGCLVDFTEARLDGTVGFIGASFNGGGTVNFTEARLDGTVGFIGASFNGGLVAFTKARLDGTVGFTGASFNGGLVDFTKARLDGTVGFAGASFDSGLVDFTMARWSGTVSFAGASFNGGVVNFGHSSFAEEPGSEDKRDGHSS